MRNALLLDVRATVLLTQNSEPSLSRVCYVYSARSNVKHVTVNQADVLQGRITIQETLQETPSDRGGSVLCRQCWGPLARANREKPFVTLGVFVRDFSLFLNPFKPCSWHRVEASLIPNQKPSVLYVPRRLGSGPTACVWLLFTGLRAQGPSEPQRSTGQGPLGPDGAARRGEAAGNRALGEDGSTSVDTAGPVRGTQGNAARRRPGRAGAGSRCRPGRAAASTGSGAGGCMGSFMTACLGRRTERESREGSKGKDGRARAPGQARGLVLRFPGGWHLQG